MPRYARPSRERILALAVAECERLNIPYLKPEMVFERTQRAVVAFLRARVIRTLYATGDFSTSGIGEAFGGMDHTSIVHAKGRRDLDGMPAGIQEFINRERAVERRVLSLKEEARIIELLYRPKEAAEPRLCREEVKTAAVLSSFIAPIPLHRLMAGRA